MGSMSDKKEHLSEAEIDEVVTAQADDESAWERPVRVKQSGAAALLAFGMENVARLPITVDPDVMSGTPVFRGTRVPVAALLDNLAAGLTLDEFLQNYPTVTREQAREVLEFSKETLTRLARVA
jgi:uncharacterized protein (DUF433 family)